MRAPAVMGALVVLSFADPARAGELGLEVSGLLGGGYDSNYLPVGGTSKIPPQSNQPMESYEAGFWTLDAAAAGWVSPVPMLDILLVPEVDLVHFFDNELLVRPGVSAHALVRPHEILEIDVGVGYRYLRFSRFDENRFHEPYALASLTVTPGDHEVFVGYLFGHRSLPADDGREHEHLLYAGWEATFLDLLRPGAGLEWTHIEGLGDRGDVDDLTLQFSFEVFWRILDAGVSYDPAFLWYEGGLGQRHAARVWVGVTWPEWLRFEVSYRYQELGQLDDLPAWAVYSRHVAMLTVRATWGATTTFTPGPPPEGISVSDDGTVTFRVEAPGATDVRLVGSHDGWNERGTAFESGDDGAWTLEIEMQPGIHEVTYVIDGEVVLPPGAGTTVDDGFGGLNAVVVVP